MVSKISEKKHYIQLSLCLFLLISYMCSRNKSNRRECNRKTRLQLFIVVLFVLVDRKPLGVQTDRLPDDDVAAECCRNKQIANQAW